MGTKKLAILFFLSVLLAFFAGYFSSTVIENQSSIYSSDMFTSITDAFQEYYYYDINDTEVNHAFIASMEAIINQYAEDNNDPYTRLRSIASDITPTDAEGFDGLGITFGFNDDNEMVIYDVLTESSVYGVIYPGDVIVGVVENDANIMFKDLANQDEVLNHLSGTIDDMKTLIVDDPDGVETTVDATYQYIATPTAYSVDLGVSDIAYIRITQFSAYERNVTLGTSDVFNSVLVGLEQTILTDDTKTLIIDLRDNPGGALSALNNPESSLPPGITQQLLVNDPANPVFTMTDNNGDVTEFFGRLTEPKAYDIKVLVNAHSASASEVLASSLMEAGYTLYGEETYGKGVYQNTIYLQDILNVTYYLTYTEGTWNYGDNLNVMDTPLLVTPIEQDGMYTIQMPFYTGEVARDDVSLGLILYQEFFNTYFQYQDQDLLRTDGYFDVSTEVAVSLFQEDMELPMTGVLDRATADAVYTYYKGVVGDINQDTQLQSLITSIEGSNQ